ncbi:hypothetical protein NUSPORA_01982 [Nucleospora cyclopteri]
MVAVKIKWSFSYKCNIFNKLFSDFLRLMPKEILSGSDDCTMQTEHNSLADGLSFGLIGIFSPGNSNFMLYNIALNLYQLVKTESKIRNLQIFENRIFVFYERSFEIFRVSRKIGISKRNVKKAAYKQFFMVFEKISTVYSAFVTSIFPISPFKLEQRYVYIGSNSYCVGNSSNPLYTKTYEKLYINGDFLFIFHKKNLEIYKKYVGFVHKIDINKYGSCFCSIRNKKLYILYHNEMLGDKIEGHDLNLYLKDLAGFKVHLFHNFKDKILLYSSQKKEMRVYEKNLEKLILACSADVFLIKNETIYVLYGNRFTIYTIPNKYQDPFLEITTSIKYAENEDEFDKSDSSTAEFSD